MSIAEKILRTPEEYLAKERQADSRSEFYRGEMSAMPRSNWAHTRIKDNLARHAGNQLEGGPCEVYSSDLRVKVSASGLYTYPDITIVCDEAQFEDAEVDTLLNPRVVAEVLSESTEKYDRGAKFGHYRQLPSVQEYVLVAHDQPLVERYVRQEDTTWTLKEYRGLEQTFEFVTAPVRIPLADIYRGITFPETTNR
jgi:Uma2 family endonuclease